MIAYGADPSGLRDSTSAFQGAINATTKAGGGRVSIPCGTYLLDSPRGTAAISITTPTVSLAGSNESCVTLNYRGFGTAIVLQMVPFTIRPGGRISGFTIRGTRDAEIGIKIGGVVGAKFEDLSVNGFSEGEAFRMEDSVSALPPDGSWTERTVWIGVSETQNKVGWHLTTSGHPRNNSFGYNDFLNIAMNVSTGQTGFWLDANGYLYNGTLRAICNADEGGPGTESPICLRSSGNWTHEFVWLTGEFSSAPSKEPRHAISLKVDKGGSFNGFGEVNASGMTTLNLNPPNFEQRVNLNSPSHSWDTGTLRVNGSEASPQVAFGGRGGNIGITMGKDIESPFVTMYDSPGNQFSVASLPYGSTLNSMKYLWSIDSEGDIKVTGNERANGAISAAKGFAIPTSAKRPTCNNSTRGTIWVEQTDQPAGDSLQVCQKVGPEFKWILH